MKENPRRVIREDLRRVFLRRSEDHRLTAGNIKHIINRFLYCLTERIAR